MAAAMIKVLSSHGNFTYSFELIAEVRRIYKISESRQRRACKRAGIKGAHTSVWLLQIGVHLLQHP